MKNYFEYADGHTYIWGLVVIIYCGLGAISTASGDYYGSLNYLFTAMIIVYLIDKEKEYNKLKVRCDELLESRSYIVKRSVQIFAESRRLDKELRSFQNG